MTGCYAMLCGILGKYVHLLMEARNPEQVYNLA